MPVAVGVLPIMVELLVQVAMGVVEMVALGQDPQLVLLIEVVVAVEDHKVMLAQPAALE